MDLDFEVVDLGPANHPEVGEQAPDFVRPLVTDEYWEDAALSTLTDDQPVLLVFHSMDGAFPATYVWKELTARSIDEYDLTVVGLSVSTPYEHKSFIDERNLAETGIRLFSDPTNGVAEQYGIVNDLDGMTGIAEPRPAVFLLEANRTVEYAWVAEQWPDFPDYDELETAVERLV
jgi:peroxiredoxin